MQNWVKILIYIFLAWAFKGPRNNNLAKVIMEALMIDGGLPRDQIPISLSTFK
jgi:hypothetical protein